MHFVAGGKDLTWFVGNYRPRRSCGKIMFLHLSVILFTQRPLDRDPPGQRPLDRGPPNQRSPRQRPPWTETHPNRDPHWIETPLDRDPPGQRPPWTVSPPSPYMVMSGRYASYWNAFLLFTSSSSSRANFISNIKFKISTYL